MSVFRRSALQSATNWALAAKKTIYVGERERPDVAAKWEAWGKILPDMDADKLVFLDESGVNTNMARLYAKAKGGERAHDGVPLNTGIPITILSSVRLDAECVGL